MKKTCFLFAFIVCLSFNAIAQKSTGKTADYEWVNSQNIPVCTCEDLLNVSIPNVVIESSVLNKQNNTCWVTAIVTHPPFDDKVKVVIALPKDNWNGRFIGLGGAGFSGGDPSGLSEPVSKGFAAGCTNAGHDGEQLSGSFALDKEHRRLRWQEIRDFSYLGIHDMTFIGKELVRTYYGKPARYSYFIGGSTGGRQALTEVQMYPQDYDGMIALNPAIYWNHFIIGHLWPQAVMHDANNYVTKEKFQAVTNAVIKECDGDDGRLDGIIDDPVNCKWDPEKFVGTRVGESVFTAADAEVVRKIWEGPRSYNGEFLWYGTTRGSDITIHASSGEPMMPLVIGGEEWVRYFLLLNPDWNSKALTKAEFYSLFYQSVEQYATTFEAGNHDLSVFRNNGGKLLILQGLSDNIIPPEGIINYFENMQNLMGGYKKTSKFARLFLFPGDDHGFAGPGGQPVGYLDALIKWVEDGKAPEYLIAESRDNSGVVMKTRTIFPYKRNK